MKRTGSVDSLLSVHNIQLSSRNPSEDYSLDQSALIQVVDSPPNDSCQPYVKGLLTPRNSNASIKSHKISASSKSSTYYLGSAFDSLSALSPNQHSFYGNKSSKIPVTSMAAKQKPHN